MNKSVDKEKPQSPAVTEDQGGKSVKGDDKYNPDICPLPATPSGCYLSTEIESYRKDHYLSVNFIDYNEQGKRPDRADVRLLIDLNFNENATNRILACLSFFKWTGQQYVPVSLIEDHDDLRYIVLGNIDEFEVKPEAEQERKVMALIEKERAEKGVNK